MFPHSMLGSSTDIYFMFSPCRENSIFIFTSMPVLLTEKCVSHIFSPCQKTLIVNKGRYWIEKGQKKDLSN